MLITHRRQVVLSTLAILGFVLCMALGFPASGQNIDATSSKLMSLLEERRDVLKARVEIFDDLVSKARSAPEELIAARDDLLKAEYELAANAEQRIGVLQQQLENAKQLESVLEQRKIAARGTATDVLLAKSRRLGIEIQLLREQQSATNAP